MSGTCKGYTSTSEIKTFDSNVKQKVLNDEKHSKHQSLIPIYATFYRSIMIRVCTVFLGLFDRQLVFEIFEHYRKQIGHEIIINCCDLEDQMH